jgi:hypothetical protein
VRPHVVQWNLLPGQFPPDIHLEGSRADYTGGVFKAWFDLYAPRPLNVLRHHVLTCSADICDRLPRPFGIDLIDLNIFLFYSF